MRYFLDSCAFDFLPFVAVVVDVDNVKIQFGILLKLLLPGFRSSASADPGSHLPPTK